MGLTGLFGEQIIVSDKSTPGASLIIGTPASSSAIRSMGLEEVLSPLGKEGYLIRTLKYQGKTAIFVVANSEDSSVSVVNATDMSVTATLTETRSEDSRSTASSCAA